MRRARFCGGGNASGVTGAAVYLSNCVFDVDGGVVGVRSGGVLGIGATEAVGAGPVGVTGGGSKEGVVGT